MKIFSRKFKSSIDETKAVFRCYEEPEQHSIFNPIKPYTSYRIGIHAYIKEGWVTGYYESGKLSRQNSLLLGKSWFFIRLKEKGRYTSVKGYIGPDPFLSLCLGLSLLLSSFNFVHMPTVQNAFYILLELGILLFVISFLLKDSLALYQDICSIFDILSQKDHW